MAYNKKSFVAYVDWKETFNALPDEKAGQLIKHILAYVNDENPHTDDILINAVFANIRQTLKRDLLKYDEIREKRSFAGKESAKQKQHMLTHVESVQHNLTNSTVSVNDSVSVIDKEEKIICLKNEFLKQLKTLYPKPTEWEKVELNKFYTYWIEPNKSKTKLKWQMQKTWDLKMRINTWFNNAEIWEAKNAKQSK